MTAQCDVPGCTGMPMDCWQVRLCIQHGTAANVALFRLGMDAAPWEDKCAAVAEWLRKRKAKTGS